MVVNKWHRRRDYFPALVAAEHLNGRRTKTTDHYSTPEEVLLRQYPKTKEDVMITEHDPDRGALGDWRGLRGSLKEVTTKKKAQRARRPRPMS